MVGLLPPSDGRSLLLAPALGPAENLHSWRGSRSVPPQIGPLRALLSAVRLWRWDVDSGSWARRSTWIHGRRRRRTRRHVCSRRGGSVSGAHLFPGPRRCEDRSRLGPACVPRTGVAKEKGTEASRRRRRTDLLRAVLECSAEQSDVLPRRRLVGVRPRAIGSRTGQGRRAQPLRSLVWPK